MLWIILLLILALPVLLGMLPGSNSEHARRLLLRCIGAGALAGVLLALMLLLASAHVPFGTNLLFPVIGGAAAGAMLGLLLLVGHRVRLR